MIRRGKLSEAHEELKNIRNWLVYALDCMEMVEDEEYYNAVTLGLQSVQDSIETLLIKHQVNIGDFPTYKISSEEEEEDETQ